MGDGGKVALCDTLSYDLAVDVESIFSQDLHVMSGVVMNVASGPKSKFAESMTVGPGQERVGTLSGTAALIVIRVRTALPVSFFMEH
jgi:hypothetical protein